MMMKNNNNDSLIVEKLNGFFAKSQEFLRPYVSASLLLQRFDYLIMLLMIILLCACLFTQTGILGIIATAIIIFAIFKLFFIKGQGIEISKSSAIMLGFLAICFISVLFSPYTAYSVKGFSKTLIFILYYFCAAQFFRYNKNKIVPLIFIMALFVTFEAGFAVLQSLNPLDEIATWQDTSYMNPEDVLSRVYGTLKPYNPNLLCGYLLVGLAPVITVTLWSFIEKHKKTFAFSLIAVVLTFWAIFLTGCRGGYIGAFATVLATFLIINNISKKYFSEKFKKIWKSVSTAAICIAGFFIVCTPSIFKRILSIFTLRGDSSTSFRMNVYTSTWKMFLDNWFSGIGVGNDTFRNMYGLYMRTGYDALGAYSIYLEIAVESGIFAFIAFFGFFASIIKSSIDFLKSDEKPEQKAIVISIFVMIIGVFAHGFFDTVFFRPQLQFLFWTNIAILSVTIEGYKKQKKITIKDILTDCYHYVKENIIKSKNLIEKLTDKK